MICDDCQGKTYPRQCRNSAAWRKAQGAPSECPYGIELNNLPIGDNAPQGASVWRGDCCWREVVPTGGCCDNELWCTRGNARRRVTAAQCAACKGAE